MATGSFSVLQKNLFNSVGGVAKFAAAAPGAFATWKKIKDRQWEHGPQHIKDQAEQWEDCQWKRHFCQHKNIWVDPDLGKVVSQKELAAYHHFKVDSWKMAHWGMLLPIMGGYAAIPYLFWFGNNTWVPSGFNATPEQLAKWREDQDLYRYKHAPHSILHNRQYFCTQLKFSETGGAKIDEVYEKNDVRKDPTVVAAVAKGIDEPVPFWRCRRKQLRVMARAMGIPTFPMWFKINIQARIKDYWEIAWNEDYMTIQGQLHKSFTDEELQDYCWRRFLAPYDKNLTREQLTQRLEDYFQVLGKDFIAEGKTPNIWIFTDYCLSYYHDPAYLEGDISELDKNDFDHLQSWGKDAFLKRLEFENGPLRDQVEAHSFKVLEERKKRLEE